MGTHRRTPVQVIAQLKYASYGHSAPSFLRISQRLSASEVTWGIAGGLQAAAAQAQRADAKETAAWQPQPAAEASSGQPVFKTPPQRRDRPRQQCGTGEEGVCQAAAAQAQRVDANNAASRQPQPAAEASSSQPQPNDKTPPQRRNRRRQRCGAGEEDVCPSSAAAQAESNRACRVGVPAAEPDAQCRPPNAALAAGVKEAAAAVGPGRRPKRAPGAELSRSGVRQPASEQPFDRLAPLTCIAGLYGRGLLTMMIRSCLRSQEGHTRSPRFSVVRQRVKAISG